MSCGLFVHHKKNKQWLWLAVGVTSREIVGAYVGTRQLWQSLLPLYRQCAVRCTDFWSAYTAVPSSKRHRAVGKATGQTNVVERLNNTLRQRVSRLVRKSLAFSKSLANHIGLLLNFSHHYNSSLLLRLYPNLFPFLMADPRYLIVPGDFASCL